MANVKTNLGHGGLEMLNETECMALMLADALTDLLAFQQESGKYHAVNSMYVTPAEQLRRQADEIERKDAAIQKARKAITAYNLFVAPLPPIETRND